MRKMFQLGSAYGGVDIGDTCVNIPILRVFLEGEAPGKGDHAESYLDCAWALRDCVNWQGAAASTLWACSSSSFQLVISVPEVQLWTINPPCLTFTQ